MAYSHREGAFSLFLPRKEILSPRLIFFEIPAKQFVNSLVVTAMKLAARSSPCGDD